MRIMFIPHLPTLFGRRYQLSKHLVKAGHEVHLILWDMPYPLSFGNLFKNIKNSLKSETYKKEGIIVHKIIRCPLIFPWVNRLLFKKQIRSLFKNENIDIIISQSFFSEVEPPLDLPFIYDLNDDHQAFADIYGSRIYKLAYKLLKVKKTIMNQIKNALAITTVSERLLKFAKNNTNVSVYKIPNGVEKEFLKKQRINKNNYSIGYVSHFGEWSKLEELLYSIKDLKKKYPLIKLNLIGDGPEIANAKKIIKKLRLEKNIKLYGKVDNRKRVFEILNNCEICLNISDKNSFRDASSPIKVFEYSALGKKIISTKLKEVESLNFPNVYFWEGEKIRGLTKKIEEVFHKKIGSKKIKKIMENYTWENLSKKLSKILKHEIKKIKEKRDFIKYEK